MLFCCLWRNVKTSCHKHFVVVSRRQQTPPLTTSDKCHNLSLSGGTALITPVGRSVDSTRWSQILAQNRDFCLPHLHLTPPLGGTCRNIAMTFGMEKLEWQKWIHLQSYSIEGATIRQRNRNITMYQVKKRSVMTHKASFNQGINYAIFRTWYYRHETHQ